MAQPHNGRPGRRKQPVKQLGEGAVDPLSQAVTERDMNTMDMVRDALARKQAVLAYQPIVQATNPAHIAFHEGLVRILDKTGRPIPAKDFMGEVEDSEVGRQIDCLTLELGLIALTADPALRLSVNMSARSVGYTKWMRTLESGLAGDGTVAERLILEISEPSAMSMPEIVTSFMGELQGMGISFALDDFGSGTTNFRYLRNFYFDILKLDGQFSRDVARDPDNQVIIETLVNIGRNLDMFTVASKVENGDDARFLAAVGVDCLQGFHFGAPKLTLPNSESPKQRRQRQKRAG